MYHKLNLPKINLPEVWHTDDILLKVKIGGYISYHVTEEVRTQVLSLFPKEFFPNKISIVAQIIGNTLNGIIHKDARAYAINYMLIKGGSDATTSVYNDDKILEDSYVQQKNEWYLLHTYNNHAVHKVEDTRVALSISIYDLDDAQWEWLKCNYV